MKDCGADGRLCVSNHWYRTLCDACIGVEAAQRPRTVHAPRAKVVAEHRSGEWVGHMTDDREFWEDLSRDLDDPEFEREYAAESELIAELDAAMSAEAAAAYDAIVADPSGGIPADELRERLTARRRRTR
jgi:hypothetical protein